MPPISSTNPLLRLLTKNRDILLPIWVVGILLIMIVPIGAFWIDLLLTFSIAGALLILFVGIYMLKPLDFSVFPSMLLLITLFRLSLNIATTRQILLNGNSGYGAAGKIIETFGQFVVQGNYLIGAIIFLILVIVNFVVITKGAGRIAEVSARFTLDAMPGKQMSIDADLNAGLINEEQARLRRTTIEREADFYGAMDGASKFVRGDAIAGVIITAINIIGGLVVGVFFHGMALEKAAMTYVLLTIGDGLVTQIPSLIVSTAAGMVVTRAASENTLGETATREFLLQPRALAVAAVILSSFIFVKGMPKIPFIFLSGIIFWTAYIARESMRSKELIKTEEALKAAKAAKAEPSTEPDVLESLLRPELVSLDVGYGLLSLVDKQQSGDLLERITSLRRQIALDMGFIIPQINIKDNLELKPGGYQIFIKGCQVADGDLMTNHLLAMSAEEQADNPLNGIPTTEPAFGLPALWIPERDRERAQAMGYTVVNLSTVITTHLAEVLKQHAHELFTRQETQKLIDSVGKRYPKVIEGVIPDMVSLGSVQKVLQNLLRERVSIRDLVTIIETLAEHSSSTKSPEILTEYVRQALGRAITRQYMAGDGKLYVMMFDQEIEELISQATQFSEQGSMLALEPSVARRILDSLRRGIEQFSILQMTPIVACVPRYSQPDSSSDRKVFSQPDCFVAQRNNHDRAPRNGRYREAERCKLESSLPRAFPQPCATSAASSDPMPLSSPPVHCRPTPAFFLPTAAPR